MPDFDSLARKAEEEVRQHPEQADAAVNRVEQEADKATDGRFATEVGAAAGEAEKLLGTQQGGSSTPPAAPQ